MVLKGDNMGVLCVCTPDICSWFTGNLLTTVKAAWFPGLMFHFERESLGNVRPSPDHIVSDGWRNEKRGEKQKQKWQLGEKERTEETQSQSAGGSVTPANLPALHHLTFPVGPPPERSHICRQKEKVITVQDENNSHTNAFHPAENINGKNTHVWILLDQVKPVPYRWDPQLVLVLLRWFFQLRLTGQGTTAATWDISLFIWTSLLKTKWWETEVAWALKSTNIENKRKPLRPLAAGSVNENLFIF